MDGADTDCGMESDSGASWRWEILLTARSHWSVTGERGVGRSARRRGMARCDSFRLGQPTSGARSKGKREQVALGRCGDEELGLTLLAPGLHGGAELGCWAA